MPKEERRIFFDYDETYKAIHMLCAQKGVPRPPGGRIALVEDNMENSLEVILTVENGRTGSVDNIKYSKDFIVAGLMALCREIGVPLPKGSNKTLEIGADKVVLRVQLLR